MVGYVLHRFALGAITLLGVSIGAFAIMQLAPGDPIRIMLGVRATPEQVELMRDQFGLSTPLVQQFTGFLAGAVTFDFGESIFKSAPVGDLISARFPVTLQLVTYGMTLALVISVPLGVLSAIKRNRASDHIVRTVSMLGFAMPSFWIGLMLILFFGVGLDWFPVSGLEDGALGRLASLTLPAVTLMIGVAPLLIRTLRASMLETMSADFVEAAVARGLTRRRVLFKHALRASLTSTLTVFGMFFGALLGGVVVIEAVFDVPGIGSLLVEAVANRDFPVVQATVLIFGAGVIVANIVTDLGYAVIDPRVRRS